jgi:hypothetical protein
MTDMPLPRDLSVDEKMIFANAVAEHGGEASDYGSEISAGVDIDPFDEILYSTNDANARPLAYNTLVIGGRQDVLLQKPEDIQKIMARIIAAREILRKHGYIPVDPGDSDQQNYVYAFGRKIESGELETELAFLLQGFSEAFEQALQPAKNPVQ